MGCLKKLQQIFIKCDLFSTSQFLRYDQQPQYRTYTGACVSFITVATFCGIFMNVMINTFSKQKIIWSLNTVESSTSLFEIEANVQASSKFMFAVSLSDYNLNDQSRIPFNVSFILREKVSSISGVDRLIPLEQCSLAHWNVNTQIRDVYYRMNFTKMLCPKIGFKLPIQGKFTSDIFRYAQIRMSKCNATINPSCMNQTQLTGKTFFFNLYILNTLINPQSKEYLTYYLQDRNYVQFTTDSSGLVNIFVSNYEITTDESISPLIEQRFESGAIINNLGQTISRSLSNGIYAAIVLRRASTTTQVQRGFSKIDDTLSYIGGLFGFVMVFLILVKQYTEYSFQLQAGSHLYHQDTDNPDPSKSFNFITFLGYLFYLLFDSFGCKMKWKMMQTYDTCRQEIQKQLDVKFLFQRLNFIENSLTFLFQDDQKQFLHLQRKPTLRQAAKLRQNYQFKQKIKNQMSKAERQMPQNPINQTFETFQCKKTIVQSDNSRVMPLQDNKIIFNSSPEIPSEGGELVSIKNKLKLFRKSSLNNEVSKKIVKQFDSNIIKAIFQAQQQQEQQAHDQQSSKNTSQKINQKNLQSKYPNQPGLMPVKTQAQGYPGSLQRQQRNANIKDIIQKDCQSPLDAKAEIQQGRICQSTNKLRHFQFLA